MITFTKTTEISINPFDGLSETIIVVKNIIDGSGIKTKESYSFANLTADATIQTTIENDLINKGYMI